MLSYLKVLDRLEFFQYPLLSDTLSDKGLQDFQKQIASWDEIVTSSSAEVGNATIELEFQFILTDGLQAGTGITIPNLTLTRGT